MREINIKRAEKIITEACEQSNRITVPKILDITEIIDFIKTFPEGWKNYFL